ncbi:MAG: DNA primase [Acidobacteriota bacterium]|nr:DNA primase [Acidobacteriota bacterium]
MEFVEQLKSSVDIVKVIGEYVRLKKMGGSARWGGLCPFHTEKTPSFSVHGGFQFYKCFGCGVGGDVLKFVMEIEGLTFYEALKLLAERNGIPMPRREYSDPESKSRSGVLEMHEQAARLFQQNLNSPAGADARRYLAERGLSPETIAEFGLGYSDSSGSQLTRRFEPDFPPDLLEKSGLVRRRESGGLYDYFRGRLMFPIHNESGKPIAFGARALRADDQPKYLNSPETAVYKKTAVLYNLHRAKTPIRKADYSILVEGYMDVIGVWAGGVQNVVASCGTALTSPQVRSLKRHAESIVVNFDPDAAGSNAAERSLQMLLDESMHVRVLQLEGDLDPDEFVKQSGADAYRARLQSAPSYYMWLFHRARARFDNGTAEGRIQAFKYVTPAIHRITDKLERLAMANEAASYLGLDQRLVREQFSHAASSRPAQTPRPPSIPAGERLLLQSLLSSQTARDRILPELRALPAFDGFLTRNVLDAIFTMHQDHAAFRFSDLEGRLDGPDRDLLSSLICADEVWEEDSALEQALSCLESLKAQHPRSEIADLRTRIKAAEREGKIDEALRLAQELDRRSRC